MNNELKEAMIEAIHEVAASSTSETFANFVALIKSLREECVSTYMADNYVKLHVWDIIRKDIDLTKSVLNGATNFTLGITEVDRAIELFAGKLICYNERTKIVDDDLLGKTVTVGELTASLKANYWLFFILYCSVNMYTLNATAIQYKVSQNA